MKMSPRQKLLELQRAKLWILLEKRGPFARGSLNATGAKVQGKRRTFALVSRDGEQIRSTYIPTKGAREVEVMVKNYKEARRLLAKIADWDIKLLLLRIEEQKEAELKTRKRKP